MHGPSQFIDRRSSGQRDNHQQLATPASVTIDVFPTWRQRGQIPMIFNHGRKPSNTPSRSFDGSSKSCVGTSRATGTSCEHLLGKREASPTELKTKVLLMFDSMYSARYRDLLGTAETIVEMNGEMHEVEENLVGIGRKCNPRSIEKKAEQLNRLRHDSSEKGLGYNGMRWDLR